MAIFSSIVIHGPYNLIDYHSVGIFSLQSFHCRNRSECRSILLCYSLNDEASAKRATRIAVALVISRDPTWKGLLDTVAFVTIEDSTIPEAI